jgi:hypothetical protein
MTKDKKKLIGIVFGVLSRGAFGLALASFTGGSRDERELVLPLAFGGVVSAIICIAVLLSVFKKKQPSVCPKCGSPQRIEVSKQEKGQSPFRVLPLQKCGACGHLWEQLAPRWLLVVGVAMAAWFIVIGFVMLFDNSHPEWLLRRIVFGLLFLTIGGLVSNGCVRRFRKSSGTRNAEDEK